MRVFGGIDNDRPSKTVLDTLQLAKTKTIPKQGIKVVEYYQSTHLQP